MPWKTGRNNPALGVPPMLGTPSGTPDTSAQVPVGTIAVFEDEVQRYGEFIYLPGALSVGAADAVAYDLSPAGASVLRLSNANASNSARPVAWAVQALGAGTFGWYQISGLAIVNVNAGAVAGPMFASVTAGSVTHTPDAGDQIAGARLSSAIGTPAAGKAYATINRPRMQTQIT